MVGAIQDLLLDPSFVELQESFASRHCDTFEDTPENKLCYTEIFNEWQNLIESFIEKRVSEEIEVGVWGGGTTGGGGGHGYVGGGSAAHSGACLL